MGRLFLVSIALLATSLLNAGTANDVNDIAVKTHANRQISRSHASESAGMDLINSLKLSNTEAINHLEDNYRTATNIKALRNQSILRQHQDQIDKQKHQASIRKAKKATGNDLQPKAPARTETRERLRLRSQWSQPFRANGDFKLSGIKYQYDLNSGTFEDYGVRSYTYDASGIVIGTQVTYVNKDNILNKINLADVIIPLNAIYIQDENYSDGIIQEFYIDVTNGQQYEVSYYENTSVTIGKVNIPVNRIRRRRDKDGNMVELEKAVSEVDAQGRPIVTIVYDSFRDKDSNYKLKPFCKYEYEYPDGEIICCTSSLWTEPENGESYWSYTNKTVSGIDSEGYTHYEEDIFDPVDSIWYGTTKYKYFDNDTCYIRVNWAWDYNNNEWVLSDKNKFTYNSEYFTTSYELMDYDAALKSFYLREKGGYGYLDETTVIADWFILYDAPQTADQLSNPESLIGYGEKQEYMHYTAQELNINPSDFDTDNLPLKYQITSFLQKDDKSGSYDWVNSSKLEYQYVLLPSSYRNPDKEMKIINQKQYDWNSDINGWRLMAEYKNEYDKYGETILCEEYSEGKITYRAENHYTYLVIKESGTDVLRKYTTFEECWDLFNDGSFRPTYMVEKEYNDQGDLLSYSEYEEWDPVLDTWSEGNKYIYEYDGVTGRQASVAKYEWDKTQKIWFGAEYYRIEVNIGHYAKLEYFIGNGIDSQGKQIWIPDAFEELIYNDEGKLSVDLIYDDWNTEKNNWDNRRKYEHTYNSDGFETLQIIYIYSNGQWVYYQKTEREYNTDGFLTLYLKSSFDAGSSKWVNLIKEVFTYNQSNEEQDYYYYEYDNGNEILKEKEIAVTDGNTTTYTYSILNDAGQWEPYEKNEYNWDLTNLIYTHCQSEWNTTASSWLYKNKEINKYELFNGEYHTLLSEEYVWDTSTGKWVGGINGKTEYGYDERGEIIMTAHYYWNSKLDEWEGLYKEEEAYDEFENLTLYAEYAWDKDRKDWYGVDYKEVNVYNENNLIILSEEYLWDSDNWKWYGTSKVEKEYDADGKNIMRAYFDGTDSQGNWIGDSKFIEYYRNETMHYECYIWNNQHNDWEGDYMYNETQTDSGFQVEEYEWDYADWCWLGVYKYDTKYTDDTNYTIEYLWDKETKSWVKDNMYELTESETDTSTIEIHTTFRWDNTKWVYFSRRTEEEFFNSYYNREYTLITNELYNTDSDSWNNDFAVKYLYIYEPRTGIESISASASISVSEGVITVNAAQGSSVTIASVTGGQIATGTGSLSTAVAPGIYMVTVNGNTTKVNVR